MIDETGNRLSTSFFAQKQIELPKGKSLAKILGYNGVMGNTMLMNHQLVQHALPFPKSLKYHDYWLALVNETFGIRKTLNTALINYRIHSLNASENRKSKGTSDQPSPFTDDNRRTTLVYFLSHYDLNKKDRAIITAFYDYLDLNKNKLTRMLLLLKYGFLRNNWHYRFRVLRRILRN
jgi:hypothetical protein